MMCAISWLKIELGLQIRFWIHGTLLDMYNGDVEF